MECQFLVRYKNWALISLGYMVEEKSLTKVEHSHKIIDQLVLVIDVEVSPETMRVMDQGSVVIILKTLHHAKWCHVLVTLPIKKVTITVIYVII